MTTAADMYGSYPRSRRCHRVKQSTGWTVTQPRHRHRWTTPSGRSYTQGPMRYPA